MICSEPFHYTLRGRPINLFILRTDGYCWGRIVLASGENFDVEDIDSDMYDWDDAGAAELIVNHVRAHGDNALEPTNSWVQNYEEPTA